MSEFQALALDPGNRPAVNAALAVADSRDSRFAPLLVIGPPGSGKTELLRAIASRLVQTRPDTQVEFLEPAVLAGRLREAILSGRVEETRRQLSRAGLLLLDGLERLPEHRDIHGEVTDLLDARRAAGLETVVVASADPESIDGLDPRLVRRLRQGTRVDWALPGSAARLGLLRSRNAGAQAPLPEPALQALARAEFASLRDYFGALSRLIAFQEASPVPLSTEDALVLVGAGGGAVPDARPEAPSEPPPDEFGVFVSEVADELSERIEDWRRRIGEAITRWKSRGFHTRKLEALLEEDTLGDPEPILREYEAAARELADLAAEAATLSPDLAGAEALRDPDQLPAARLLVDGARFRAPLSAPLAHYRWEDFVEGPASRLSVRAGRDIIMEPGRRYSPLLVTGGPGTGKSHFLHGLGNALAARGIGPIVCLAGPAFAAEVRALADSTAAAEWRHRYQWAGAFLLDDLHLLAGEARAQQELAVLVAELVEGRRQTVFASLHPLEQLTGLDARLAGVLQSGLSVELPPPDREVRLAVIRRMFSGMPAEEDAALLDYLGGRPAESVRAVQGMVQRVLSAAAAQQRPPTAHLAREVLELGPGSLPRPRSAAGAQGRGSGIPAPGAGLVRSGEKMVKRWPRIADRLLGELR